MRCPDLESWTAFYGGETSERETERLSDHLQDCERCRREFDQLCGLGAAMRGALVRRPRAVRPSRPSAVPLAIAAAFALAAVAVLVYPKEKPGPTPVTIAQTPITIVEAPAAPAPPPPLPAPRLPEAPTAARPELTPRPALPAPEIPAPTPVEAETPAPPVEAPVKVEPAATRVVEKSEAVAALERIEGEVVVTGPAGRVPARSNQPLEAGSGLSASGARSRAVVRFADGTRVELGEKTVVAQISDRAGAKGVGKWIEVSEGTVTVDAAHQPADRALILATPQGEARVVGTVFRLVVDPAATRLEVLEGKVRLSRPGAAVDVHGGFGATASAGVELASRPMPRMGAESICRFTFDDGRLPKIFEAGTLEKGPERTGSRFCVAGAMIPGATSGGHVKLNDDGKGLFNYSDELFLAFDYWADDTVRTLDLHVWSRAQQVTFGTTVWNTPREQWTHLVLPLSEFVRTEPDRLLHLKPGEAVPNLWIQAGQPGGKLYLDNLEIVRLRKKEARR